MKEEKKYYNTNDVIDGNTANEPFTPYGFIATARMGVAKEDLVNLAHRSGLSVRELSQYLSITERTIQRLGDGLRFRPDVSERILMIASLYAQGFEVFGDEDKFRSWMSTPNTALGGITPISLMDTAIGIQLLEQELIKIAHGITA